MPNFFNSQTWKNRLIAAAATSFGQAAIAAAQDADYINRLRGKMPPGVALITGVGVGFYRDYNQVGIDVTLDRSDYPIYPTIFMIVNTALASLTAPYFAGNYARALTWSAAIVGTCCASLAYCITPQPVKRQNPPSNEPAKPATPTFRERFSNLRENLNNLITAAEYSDSKCSKNKFKQMKKLKLEIDAFEEKNKNLMHELMNDPITLPESGITYDRADIEKHISLGNRFCPYTKITLKSRILPKTNLDRKNDIDEGLKNFLQRFARLQENDHKTTEKNSLSQAGLVVAANKPVITASIATAATAAVLPKVGADVKEQHQLRH